MRSGFFFAALFALLFASTGAFAAPMQAVWKGTVRTAESAVLFPAIQLPNLIGKPITYSTRYNTLTNFSSVPGEQSASTGGLRPYPPLFFSQELNLDGELLPIEFWQSQRVSLSTSNALANFTMQSSSVDGRYFLIARGFFAQLQLDLSSAPVSLSSPFTWNKADGGLFSGYYEDTILSPDDFRSLRLWIDWDSVQVSAAVPGPASGLLLITAIALPLIGSRLRRSRRSAA